MNRHIFEIIISGVGISENVSFASVSERLRNIEMSQSSNGSLLLAIKKRTTHPMDISINEAKSEANELVDRLALLDNHHITELIYLGYKNEKNELVKERKNVTLKSTLTCVLNNPTEYYNRIEIKKLLNTKDNLGVIRTYRSTLGINDKLSQYLIFYGLLYILKGESQKKVDVFVKKELKDIQIVFGNKGDETIITRIRNMIAHPNNGIDMGQLNNYVNDYLTTLKELVKNELKK